MDRLTNNAVAPTLDLHQKTCIQRALFSHYHRAATITINNKKATYNQAFAPSPTVRVLTHLGLPPMHGVLRRAILPDTMPLDYTHAAATLKSATENIISPANALHHFHPFNRNDRQDIATWKPDHIQQLELQITKLQNHQKEEKAERLPPRNPPPPKPNPPRSHRRPRQGPCYYLHTHTSARDAKGNPRWHAAPTKTPWPGLPPGVTLCQACYEMHDKASQRGQTPAIPKTPRLLRPGIPNPRTPIPQTPCPHHYHNNHERPPSPVPDSQTLNHHTSNSRPPDVFELPSSSTTAPNYYVNH